MFSTQSPTPADAFNDLSADPQDFLRRVPLRTFGSETMSQQLPAILRPRINGDARRPAPGLGTSMMLRANAFEIRTPRMATFGSPANGFSFTTHYVHMTTTTVDQVQLHQLPAGNPAILITPTLSGCSFVIEQDAAGNVSVAHVQPQAPLGGEDTRKALEEKFPDAKVYGPGEDYDSANRRVTIIGVFKNRREWRFYAQKQENDSRDYRVVSVHRIWPEA
jgi:hypothetical protein